MEDAESATFSTIIHLNSKQKPKDAFRTSLYGLDETDKCNLRCWYHKIAMRLLGYKKMKQAEEEFESGV